MSERVSIVGVTGYAGAELAALLLRHPRVELVGLYASPGASPCALEEIHPTLRGEARREVTPLDVEKLVADRPSVVVLATPNEVSAELAPSLVSAGIRVIDISGAFRLRDVEAYPRHYGFVHPAPSLLGQAVYGLTEWCDGALGDAILVANPGCYPTSVLLALKPIGHLLPPDGAVVCDSASGVSGAGKKADLATSFAEVSGNFRAYGVGSHRHEPEMRQELGIPGLSLSFVPHLLPVVRGILSTIHVAFSRPVEAEELAAAYGRAYEGQPFVHVRPEGRLPELKDVAFTPSAEIGFVVLDGGRRAVIVSAIDNLLKGAASQAVQNLNAMMGFTATEGIA